MDINLVLFQFKVENKTKTFRSGTMFGSNVHVKSLHFQITLFDDMPGLLQTSNTFPVPT